MCSASSSHSQNLSLRLWLSQRPPRVGDFQRQYKRASRVEVGQGVPRIGGPLTVPMKPHGAGRGRMRKVRKKKKKVVTQKQRTKLEPAACRASTNIYWAPTVSAPVGGGWVGQRPASGPWAASTGGWDGWFNHTLSPEGWTSRGLCICQAPPVPAEPGLDGARKPSKTNEMSQAAG